MKPYFETDGITVYNADCLNALRALPDESVQCCVTSPPYFGLRKYSDSPDEIGTEKTPQEFIAAVVAVFAEVRRVLRNDGTCWVNLGDSYCGYKGNNYGVNPENSKLQSKSTVPKAHNIGTPQTSGFKTKDLMMIPARVAIALCDDGWYLRSEITWCKKAPMPESVTDRPTSATEKIYLLSKSAKYFYDADAVREEAQNRPFDASKKIERDATGMIMGNAHNHAPGATGYGNNPLGRNMWNYWLLSPSPCSDAHFATFPPEIPRRAILAGSRIGDVVLDPFLGSGTTAMVAQQLGRKCVGIELNAEYLPIIKKRIQAEQGRLDVFEPETKPQPSRQIELSEALSI